MIRSTPERGIVVCEVCAATGARVYEQYDLTKAGMPEEPIRHSLCVSCARQKRKSLRAARAESVRSSNPEPALTRSQLIALLDRFWDESGAGEICGRCHQQGTGCCPPMCRYLGAEGCQKKNVFCTSFVCSALLNAIAEADPETGRLLKWIKQNPGATEFRIYEMVTRVPAVDREDARPLLLPERYPGPLPLSGAKIQKQLLSLMDEVLEIRRRWRKAEMEELLPAE